MVDAITRPAGPKGALSWLEAETPQYLRSRVANVAPETIGATGTIVARCRKCKAAAAVNGDRLNREILAAAASGRQDLYIAPDGRLSTSVQG